MVYDYNMTSVMREVFTCTLCKYEWVSRVESPKTCPKCKRYDWKAKEIDKKALELLTPYTREMLREAYEGHYGGSSSDVE